MTKAPLWVEAICSSGLGAPTKTTSSALESGAPPPDTVTTSVIWGCAPEPTSTTTVIGWELLPPVSVLLVVHVYVELDVEQLQPFPDIVTSVRLDGSMPVTVTVPLVGPASAALLTVTAKAAPAYPAVKFPEWVDETASRGSVPTGSRIRTTLL